ncbi:MAG: hypothetical protein AAB955_03950 [Patescibacteria group bacterium]
MSGYLEKEAKRNRAESSWLTKVAWTAFLVALGAGVSAPFLGEAWWVAVGVAVPSFVVSILYALAAVSKFEQRISEGEFRRGAPVAVRRSVVAN